MPTLGEKSHLLYEGASEVADSFSDNVQWIWRDVVRTIVLFRDLPPEPAPFFEDVLAVVGLDKDPRTGAI